MEFFLAAIPHIAGIISAITQGGGGGGVVIQQDPDVMRHLEVLTQQNADLKSQFLNFMEFTEKQMETLRKEAMKEEMGYLTVESFLKDAKKQIIVSDRVAMLGPKGSGKSTFLWLRNEGEKPEETFGDGTKSILTEGKGGVDTVGINIEFDQILKMLTILIDKKVPDTFILFSNKIEREAIILGHLMITEFYVCPIIATAVYDQEDEKEPDESGYYSKKQTKLLKNAGFKTVTHKDPLPLLKGNRHAINNLFPNGYLEIPTWTEFKSDPSSLNVIRYTIGRMYWKFKTQYGSNELNFLNAFQEL